MVENTIKKNKYKTFNENFLVTINFGNRKCITNIHTGHTGIGYKITGENILLPIKKNKTFILMLLEIQKYFLFSYISFLHQ